jgi:hypothetical protein
MKTKIKKKVSKNKTKKYQTNLNSKFKILNLIIYNDKSPYEKNMKNELEKLYNNNYNNFVKQFFICFNNNITKPVEEDRNILYIKGKETFIPGILDKTIKAMEYCFNNYDFDYLVRSNISTVIDFKKIPFYKIPLDKIGYASSLIFNIQKLDPKSGIINNTLFGTKFAMGTNIILNKLGFKYILDNKESINMDIIDDVSIGLLMKKITTPITLCSTFILNVKKPGEHSNNRCSTFIFNKLDKKGTIFRNKSKNRKTDVKRIKKIVNMLLKK